MRSICPSCQQAITLPDSEAGQTAACPLCNHSFTAPQLYVPSMIETPSPPPAVPPVVNLPVEPTVSEPSPDAKPQAAAPSGYAHSHFISIKRSVCLWLPPAAFTLVFFLSFFKWAGLYPGGYSAYTQNPWQALFGDFSVDPVSEKELKWEKPLDENLHSSWWLLPYLFLLLLGLLLVWSEPLVKMMKLKLPAVVEHYWSYRHAAISACAGATLFFLLVQCASGFGLERALTAKIEAATKDERDKARTPEEIQRVEMQMALQRDSLHPRTTFALKLAALSHLLAVLGIAGEMLLVHRGDKPPPRIGVMW